MPSSVIQNAPVDFAGARFDVRRLAVPGDGGVMLDRHVVVPADAVVVLPLLDEATVVMIRNERFAVNERLWELPAGTLEPGEVPIDCARREVAEETGYQSATVEPLIAFYPSPGICTELMHCFLAGDLTQVGQHLDETERITVEVIELEKSIQMIQDHTIRDGKTIATLLYYQTFIRNTA